MLEDAVLEVTNEQKKKMNKQNSQAFAKVKQKLRKYLTESGDDENKFEAQVKKFRENPVDDEADKKKEGKKGAKKKDSDDSDDSDDSSDESSSDEDSDEKKSGRRVEEWEGLRRPLRGAKEKDKRRIKEERYGEKEKKKRKRSWRIKKGHVKE